MSAFCEEEEEEEEEHRGPRLPGWFCRSFPSSLLHSGVYSHFTAQLYGRCETREMMSKSEKIFLHEHQNLLPRLGMGLEP